MEAIRKSTMFTYNLEQADIVFVDSYCYYIWWLGWSHSRGRTQEGSPGEYLMAAFKGIAPSSNSEFMRCGHSTSIKDQW